MFSECLVMTVLCRIFPDPPPDLSDHEKVKSDDDEMQLGDTPKYQ